MNGTNNSNVTRLVIPDPPWASQAQTQQPSENLKAEDYKLQTLTVHPYEWQIEDGGSSEEKAEFRAWCLDRESRPYLLRIVDFPIFGHLELPSLVNGIEFNWNRIATQKVYNRLCSLLGNRRPRRYEVIEAKKLYYHQARKSTFLRLYFNNVDSMRKCTYRLGAPINVWGVGTIKMALHETKVDPIRKLLTLRRCGYSQWFNSEGRRVTEGEKVSTLEREFIINWRSIQPLDVDWVTRPGVLSWDVEAYSKNPKAFPDAWNPSDDAYMISCIYQRRDSPETLRKIIIIYGVSSPPDPGDEYIFVNSEGEMCHKFAEVVRTLDPEILTGYNIFGFDYPFLNKRMVRRGFQWPVMGRIRHKAAVLTGPGDWSSSGYGHNSIKYLEMDGRISVDMMTIVKREHKLPKYNLDTVAKHFLNVGKDDVSPQMMFKIVKFMKILEDILESFRQKEEREQDQVRRKKGPSLLYLLKTSKSVKDYISQKQANQGIFTIEEYVELMKLVDYVYEQMKIVAKYCIKDSVVVLELFFKLSTWIYLIQLSNVAGVTPLHLFIRGQQVRGLSLIYDLAARSGFVLDARQYTDMSWSGGFVWDPIPGLWPWVICLDFKSLYPSIIIAYNICWSTLVPAWSKIKDECCHIIEWDEPIDEDKWKENEDDDDEEGGGTSKKKAKVLGKIIIKTENGIQRRYVHYRFRFLKKEYGVGLLPQQASMLIDERNKIRKDMETVTDQVVKMIMNQRQLGLKITANSLFGLLGAGKTGKLPLLEGAMSITAEGRRLIKFSNEYLVEKYGAKIIYNDTDSTMVQIPNVTNGLDCIAWGHKLEKELSAQFIDPLYLAFEKAGKQLTIKKKNYIFWIMNKNGTLPYNEDGSPKYMSKGIPLARRDKSSWQLEIVKKTLDMIVLEEPYQKFLDLVVERVVETLRGKPDWSKFSIIKSLGSSYKNPVYHMKLFADGLREIGRPAQPGDRLEYVVVVPRDPPPGKVYLGHRMRLPDIYCERLASDRPEPIDYFYYVNNLLMGCIDGYWYVGYKPMIDTSMSKNEEDDKWKILNELREQGLSSWVQEALKVNDNNPSRAVKALKLTKAKNKTVMAQRKHVSGRHIFDCRVNNKPIKTLLKGYKMDRLEEAVKSLASSESYQRLYPKIITKGLNGSTIRLAIQT